MKTNNVEICADIRIVNSQHGGSFWANRNLRLWLRTLCLVVMLGSLLACGPRYEWDEEVKLASDKVVKIHRKQKWEGNKPLGESVSYQFRESALSIVSPGDAHDVTWRGTTELLVVLDIDPKTNEYFLISSPSECWRYAKLGAPIPPYVEYRQRNNEWVRVEWTGISVGRKPNVLVLPSSSGEKSVVTWQEVRERNRMVGGALQRGIKFRWIPKLPARERLHEVKTLAESNCLAHVYMC